MGQYYVTYKNCRCEDIDHFCITVYNDTHIILVPRIPTNHKNIIKVVLSGKRVSETTSKLHVMRARTHTQFMT